MRRLAPSGMPGAADAPGASADMVHPGAARGVPASSLVCSGCGTVVPVDRPFVPRCPAARSGDDIDHVLVRRIDLSVVGHPDPGEIEPFVRYRRLFHAYHVARAAGWSDARYVGLVRSLDEAVATVEGHGFVETPLAEASGLAAGIGGQRPFGLIVKDETGGVGGSHKARHLAAILLELTVAEALGATEPGRPLAIASCGNAALAAAVLARAVRRELRVFVPDAADPSIVERLRDLDTRVVVCPRHPGVPGDPSVRALDEALAAGAIPFTCQGDRNGFAIEGGATLAWELAGWSASVGRPLDRVVVQVGGGAFASSISLGLAEAASLGWIARPPRLDTVQTEGGWPLARAYELLAAGLGATPGQPVPLQDLDPAIDRAARHRSGYMWPWETEPRSVAHGILDDETYDWLAVVRAMLATGGRPVVVPEATLLEANRLGVAETGIAADETGTAGLAGLIRLARGGLVDPGETVAVIFSGIRRTSGPVAPGRPVDDRATASR
jgi:threonine synthase